jgi:hypothetical protein
MTDTDIPLPADWLTERAQAEIERAIETCSLSITLRGTLRKYPGSKHWHLKKAACKGTLEITYWPQEQRAWCSVQRGRQGEWIEAAIAQFLVVLRADQSDSNTNRPKE